MHSIEYNLTLFKEMLAVFESFIISQELFWPLEKKNFEGVPFPQLSLGALLIMLDELMAVHAAMDPHQDRTYQDLLREYEVFSIKRRVAIEQKASRELITRTNLWRAYLEDLSEDPDSVVEYARQVRNRVLMSKLKDYSAGAPPEKDYEMFRGLDERVMLTAMSVGFLWDERLKPFYPIEEFPFLYVKPRQMN
jgi:hypothetical protein